MSITDVSAGTSSAEHDTCRLTGTVRRPLLLLVLLPLPLLLVVAEAALLLLALLTNSARFGQLRLCTAEPGKNVITL
jgi:hypothetical protein